jgi:hypothetical protein
MASGLLLATSGIYAWVAYGFVRERRWGMAVAFLCYALANVGFAWDAIASKPPTVSQ